MRACTRLHALARVQARTRSPDVGRMEGAVVLEDQRRGDPRPPGREPAVRCAHRSAHVSARARFATPSLPGCALREQLLDRASGQGYGVLQATANAVKWRLSRARAGPPHQPSHHSLAGVHPVRKIHSHSGPHSGPHSNTTRAGHSYETRLPAAILASYLASHCTTALCPLFCAHAAGVTPACTCIEQVRPLVLSQATAAVQAKAHRTADAALCASLGESLDGKHVASISSVVQRRAALLVERIKAAAVGEQHEQALQLAGHVTQHGCAQVQRRLILAVQHVSVTAGVQHGCERHCVAEGGCGVDGRQASVVSMREPKAAKDEFGHQLGMDARIVGLGLRCSQVQQRTAVLH